MDFENQEQIINLIDKIKILLNNSCNKCLANFKSGEVEPKACKNTCSYTSSGIAIIFQLLITDYDNHRDNLYDYLQSLTIDTPERVYIDSEKTTKFLMGIVNSIGFLWDVHDFQDKPADFPFPRTGINLALNNGYPWFVEGSRPQLQDGVNIISLYSTEEIKKLITVGSQEISTVVGMNFLTVHHAFVYVYNNNCILADSWNSKYSFQSSVLPSVTSKPDEDGFSIITERATGREIGERVDRPLMVRSYPRNLFQKWVDIMSSEQSNYEKIDIVKNVFLGFRLRFVDRSYQELRLCILKKEILDEAIKTGFEAERYLYGGRKFNKKNNKNNKKINKTKKYKKISYKKSFKKRIKQKNRKR